MGWKPFEGLDHQIKELSMERNALNSEVVKLEDRVDFLEAKMEKMKITHQGVCLSISTSKSICRY